MEDYQDVNPYVYCLHNPTGLTDPTGMSVEEPPTDYVNESGTLLLRTNDGSDAVITVTKDKEQQFKDAVNSSDFGLDSKVLEFHNESVFGWTVESTMENIQSWGSTPDARMNYARYWQTHNFDYWAQATKEHTSTFRKDILAWGLSIGGALYSSTLIKSSRTLQYTVRVRQRGTQDPLSHNFPYSFDETVLSTKPINYPNGYKMYQHPGSMARRQDGTIIEGVFEIGVNKNGVIDH